MNKLNSIYCLIALLSVIFCSRSGVLSQVPYNSSYEEEASCRTEYITLFTDRNMYAVNERILFSAFYRQGWKPATDPWSKVLYVELVTPSGKQVTDGKFHLNAKGSSGYLQIPADLQTGNYYVRSYTRWMKNFGPQSYSYTPLKIINPFKKQVLKEDNESSGFYAGPVRMSFPGVQCRTSKKSYTPGEEVRLELGNNGSGNMPPGEYCLTVVYSGLCDTLNAQVDNGAIPGGGEFRFNYLPEIRGVSISGSVVNTEDQTPAPQVRMHFSTLGEQSDYFGTLTDEMGRFILNLPERTGTQELFVACEPSGDKEREIRIDHDFASDPVPFTTEQFTLSSNEKEAANRMALNMQLSNAYKVVQTDLSPESGKDSILPFYGMPTSSIILDDYIKLPNMNEVFVNIVPDVFVFYNDGEPYLNIYSSFHNVSIFPPLILIDNIPIFDHTAIFLIDPERIERIDVVNEVYVRGELMYGGMIFITSRRGDMAAIDLPSGSYFFDYQAFHPGNPQSQYSFPESIPETGNNPSDRIPDTRNTLLWVDKISFGPEEVKTVRFPASAQAGEYTILLRGVSPSGEIICGKSTFKVKNKE